MADNAPPQELPRPHPRTPQRPREKPMEVLCLGLSRTGTLSTKFALKQLGYEPYHMGENLLNDANDHPRYWEEAIQAKFYGKGRRWAGQDFEKVLWRYDATTDAPCALFAEELTQAYPDAKVVLNLRDPEKWTQSVMDNFLHFLSGWRWLYLRNFDHAFSGRWYNMTWTCLNLWSGGDMRNPEAYKKYGIIQHNEFVKGLVPKDRLLEFHPSHGWKPLCEFLGKDVPKGDFPDVNEGAEVRAVLDQILLMRVGVSLAGWALWASPFAAAVGVWWWYNRL